MNSYKDMMAKADKIDADARLVLRALDGGADDVSRDALADMLRKICVGEVESDVSPKLAEKLLRSLVGDEPADKMLKDGGAAGVDPKKVREAARPDEDAKKTMAFIQTKMGLRAESPGVRRTGVDGRNLELGNLTPDEARASLEADRRSRVGR